MTPLVVGYVGRMDVNKNPAGLFPLLDGTDWHLVLAGKGAPCPAAEMEASKKDRVHVYDREIEFIGDWYAALDVYVLNSASEGSPLCIPEALLAGCRVAATDVSDLRAVFGDSLAYFERNNVESMRRAILAAPDAEEGRRVIAANLTVEKMLDQYEEVLSIGPPTQSTPPR